MHVSDFDYQLPPGCIAQTPIEPRDAARLLVDNGTAVPDHRQVRDLAALLTPGDLLVVNETKVLPARLKLWRATGGQAEVLLLSALDGERKCWEALVRPGKKLKPGERLVARDGTAVIEMGNRTATGTTFEVTLLRSDATLDALDVLDTFGEMPLPPYITERLDDPSRYQTVYAEQPASAAAPTAGLHFTEQLLTDLAQAGVQVATVELIVGLDTFRPLTVDDPLEHHMHSERYRVPPATMTAIQATRARGGRIVAVGTTTVRALESAVAHDALEGDTDLFIYRGFDWQVVDIMLTNFHLPKTTLLMMIDAFIGDRWRHLYSVALENDYRFLSFGDAMLLHRHTGVSWPQG